MAQDNYGPLEGIKVALPATTGAFKPCRVCGHDEARVVVENIGPHVGHLRCDNCGRHCAWLSRDHIAALLAQEKGAA